MSLTVALARSVVPVSKPVPCQIRTVLVFGNAHFSKFGMSGMKLGLPNGFLLGSSKQNGTIQRSSPDQNWTAGHILH